MIPRDSLSDLIFYHLSDSLMYFTAPAQSKYHIVSATPALSSCVEGELVTLAALVELLGRRGRAGGQPSCPGGSQGQRLVQV